MDAVQEVRAALGLPAGSVQVVTAPSGDVYGSPYGVTAAAVTSIAAAIETVAVLDEARTGREVADRWLDGRHACVLFHSERLLRVPQLAEHPLWGVVTGTHRAADGWIRIHANLARHRVAALEVLGVRAVRDEVVAAVSDWPAQELEDAVLAAGGVAARSRSAQAWREHPQGRAVATRPLVDRHTISEGPGLPAGRLLEGVRVLDLTRVIAGPVAGRFLASFGAEVIRIDAPLDDGSRLEVDTGLGKRRASLDLRTTEDRDVFASLLADADVLLHAFRPGAMAALGYDQDALERLRPGLVTGELSAYGPLGPWSARRGFDSVVQVACGIADRCGDPSTGAPGALPAQALDHASGYLLAAGVASSLAERERDGRGRQVAVALARTAEWLATVPASDRPAVGALPASLVAPYLVDRDTDAFGRITHVAPAGRIAGRDATWVDGPEPRGHRRPAWRPR